MKKQFAEVKTRYFAKKLMPWACIIVQVNGGFLGFECAADYQNWRKQK
jgi:hypothetical protein